MDRSQDGLIAAPADTIVIGAGPAGLATAAVLQREGISVVVVERDQVAASWRRHYDRLHLHTVSWLSNLPGLRFSRRHGRWVHRDGVVNYLDSYVRHHDLDVRTGVEVDRLEPDGDRWRLITNRGEMQADAVVVATGYNRDPFLPDWPGRDGFAGELLHGQDYRNPAPYLDRHVLVVGGGNTAAEIAVDLVEGGAQRVQLSIRTPPNVLLREVGGVPAQVTGLFLSRLPAGVADRIGRVGQRLTIGDLTRHGLPPSPRGIYTAAVQDDQIPILDVGLVEVLKAGRVEVVAAVAGFENDEVLLSDGTRAKPDAVIACAGYRRGLEPLVGHLGVVGDKGRPIVHDGETHPDYPTLHFIGYTNPITGMFRQFGIDARRIARARLSRA